jgi:signal transduction histidine kinase
VGQGEERWRTLLEAGLALSAELSLPAVLQKIVDLAAKVTGARYGALGVLGPDGRITDFFTTGISEEQRRAIGSLPMGRGILGLIVEEPRPLRLRNLRDHPRSFGFPPHHPVMTSFLGGPIRARGKVFGNLYLADKEGAEEFSEEDEEALVILATQAGVAIENARLYEASRKRERRLEAIAEITSAILRGEEPEQALEVVAARARELVDARLATVAVPVDGGRLRLRVADGEGADALRGVEFPAAGSVSGTVMQSGRPEVLADASSDPRTYQPVVHMGDIGPAMLVPLRARDRVLGTLTVANRVGDRPFTDEDLAVVEAFADQASVALEYGRAQRELRRLAVLEDRERIAKELHDGVIQSLFALGMGLQAAAAMARDEEVERRIASAVDELDRVVRDLRNYIFGLRPGLLADRQLDQALRQLVEEFGEKTGVVAVADVDPQVAAELGSRAHHVLQLAREALSNVGRHAKATTCRLSLHREGHGWAVLEVDDDGRGFDPSTRPRTGQGLRNLEDRAASLGGSLQIESVPGEGTTVRARIPL